MTARLVGFLVLALAAAPAWAHEVRPAYLAITEDATHHYRLLWKQPDLAGMAVHLVPHLSNGWLDEAPAEEEVTPRFRIRVWRRVARAGETLEGQTLTIEGLDRTITDALIDIRLADGREMRQILRPTQPSVRIHLGHGGAPVLSYLWMGIEHILTGVDHLMFVLGLMLLVKGRVKLLQTITAFTIAHSITLAGTALGLIHAYPPVVESLVALSILALAVELVHTQQGRHGLTTRYPWLIAFSFGLLHGFAFAGALSEVGLPAGQVPLALLLFNLGVEIGQLLFVAAALTMHALLHHLPRLPRWSDRIPPYAIGSFASFWLIQRLLVVVS